MAGEKIRGYRKLAGGHGTVWLDNEAIGEFQALTATITANRSDVQIGMSVDSKITGLSGEGTLTLNKVYTRGKKVIEDWNAGKDTRVRLVFSIKDPDAANGKEERVSIDNVWYNSVQIINATVGEDINEEFPFGFTPEDVRYEGEIN